MKKFAKILVVALTVCLIVGVMAVSASAAVVLPTVDGVNGEISQTTGSSSSFSGSGNAWSKGCVAISDGVMVNGTHKNCSSSCYAGGLNFNVGKQSGYDYAIVDFDFYATRYKTSAPTVLAYDEALKIHALHGGGTYSNLLYFVRDNENKWYLSADNTYDSKEDIQLADTPNTTNHITMVDNGTEVLIFVNGEYIKTFNNTFSGDTYFQVGFGVYEAEIKDADPQPDFSIKGQNPIAHLYKGEYKSGTAFGIDDYLENFDSTKNLISCVDTYYNQNYDSATFTYKDFEGNTIRTTDFEISKALTGFNKFFDLNNGWFNVNVTSWKLEDESQVIVPGGTYTLVPDDVEAVAAVKYKANLTFLDKYQFNIYVKVPDASVAEGVSFSGGTKSEVTLPDKANYYRLTSEDQHYSVISDPASFSTKITFTPVYGDLVFDSITYTANVTIDGYLTQANEFYDHEVYPKEAKLLANFFNYAKECYEYNGGNGATIWETWQTKLDKIHKDCDCLESTLPTTSGLNHEGENLSGSGYSVGYYFELNYRYISRVGLAIYVPTAESVEASSIKATLKGIKDNKTNQNITVSFTKLAATQTVGDVVCNVYLSNLGDLAIYNMLETVTITVGDKSGTYNLAEYVVANPAVEYTNALYRFAEAAKAYKEDGIVQ